MTDADHELGPLSKVVSLAHEAATAPVTAETQRDGREQLVASAARHTQAAARRRRALPMIASLAAAAALALGIWSLRPQALSYRVRGGSALASPYVGAQAGSPAEIAFSDGSRVQADPGTRLRIDEKQADGARVFVERGVATAHIVHRAHSSWLFEAGPFEVHVTGTRLTLAWDPTKEELDLTLHEGSVEVRGPIGQKPISVRAGQRFLAALRGQAIVTEEVSSASAPTPPQNTAATDAEEPASIAKPEEPPSPTVVARSVSPGAGSTSASLRQKGPMPHRDSWQTLVMHGEFETVVAAANEKGLQACLSACSAPELRALGDAARYTNRVGLAEQCLLGLRQRFADSGQSQAAAFLLGRTSESRGRTASAQHWYEVYLAESPDGEFAADALAGRMRTVAAARGNAAARSLAREYLRRYPDGVHATSASRIAGPN
jgi:transmembrane sensor